MSTIGNQLAAIRRSRLLWPVLGLGVLLLFNLVFDHEFYAIESREGDFYGPLISVIRQATRIMLVALGMTLVIATGGVDLSVGSVMAIAGALAASLATTMDLPFAAVLFIVPAAAAAIGLFSGTLVACAGIQPIVATLIMMYLGRGVALNITGSMPVRVDDPGILAMGRAFVFGVPLPILIVGIVFAATLLLTRKTAVGLFIEAVGDNETASRFCGVHPRRVKVMVYAFSGFCAGIAALVAVGDIGRIEPDRLGSLLELDAITAVVVGGTALTGGRFSLVGSIVGALLIQTLAVTLIRQGMPADIAPVPKALVIVVVCLLQAPRLRAQLFRFLHPGSSPAGAA